LTYEIQFASGVADDLRGVRAYDRSRIIDEIDAQLTHQPDVPTRRRKMLVGLEPPWDHQPPVWELRIGNWRVYYDISTDTQCVVVRAIREKPPHQTTEETL
jgi:mRNA-degrading endonuclease RelE of RelBE toxin-antitoxin system